MSRGRAFRAGWRLLLATALTLAAAAPARAQPSEDAVKAAFIPKFARYVTWPPAARPGARAPFQLCVIGRDPFGRMLDTAASTEQVDGHGVAVRRLETLEGARGCHLAFVQGQSPQETARLLAGLAATPVLTVTDSRAGPQRGIIHFAVVGGRVRFHIDQAAASARGLAISSRLLALAVDVRQAR